MWKPNNSQNISRVERKIVQNWQKPNQTEPNQKIAWSLWTPTKELGCQISSGQLIIIYINKSFPHLSKNVFVLDFSKREQSKILDYLKKIMRTLYFILWLCYQSITQFPQRNAVLRFASLHIMQKIRKTEKYGKLQFLSQYWLRAMIMSLFISSSLNASLTHHAYVLLQVLA